MKTIKYIIIALSIIGALSCNNSTTSTKNTSIIDITGLYNNAKLKYVDDFVEQIKIIKLEVNETSILSYMNELVASNKYFYIRDDYQGGSVAIFDVEGKFIKRLPNGEAEFEIGTAKSIFFDYTTECLYVLDDSHNKILKYSDDGTFLSSHYCDEYVDAIAARGNVILLAQSSTWNESGTFNIIVADTSYKTQDKIPLGTQNFKRECLDRYFHSAENGITVNMPWSSNVYDYKDDGWYQETITDKDMTLNFSEYEDSFTMRSNLSDNQFAFKGISYQSHNWRIYRFVGKSFARNMFRNTKNGQQWFAKPLPHSFYNLIQIYGVQDSNDRNIIGAIYPMDILNGSSNPDFRWDGSDMGGLISPSDMQKLRNLKEDDNPVIVLFKLKSE